MGILKETLFGSNAIGVYLSTNNNFMLYPKPTPKEKIVSIRRAFPKNFQYFGFAVNQSSLLGSYLVSNSKGMLVPTIILEEELTELKNILKNHDMNFIELDTKDNALGNLVLANDNGAVVSSDIKQEVRKIQDTLDVEVLLLDYAETRLVGSAGICNNKGCCVHPMVTDDEADMISDVLKVPVDVSTINLGDPFVHAGAVANDYGGIFGKQSSGPEMMRLTNMLQL